MKFQILMPCYNDWVSVFKLLEKIDNEAENIPAEFNVLIVNDGSKDKIPKTQFKFNKLKSVKVINMKFNQGHTRSNATGIKYLSKKLDFAYFILMDGDGEDRPEEIKLLIEKIMKNKNISVVAKRVKRSEGFVFTFFYNLHKLLTLILTGKNMNFGHYSCLTKKDMIERSVPKKVFKDAMLAWEMNGVPIPNAHGGPLRMITPGYFGINNVKHLGKVAFTLRESSVKYMKSSYRISPIGKKGSQYPSCWEMPVKSWITRPTDETGTVKAGKVQIVGVAMGGTRKVRSVKVSVDGGSSWKIAKFIGPDLGKYAWRQFVLETTLGAGKYNIASLASNGSKKQPELRMENRRGYAHNGWKDHSVNITVV